MNMMLKHTLLYCGLLLYLTNGSPAQQLINNGGFETGFTGWTRLDQTGSDGTWAQQTGTTSPVNGFTVPTPPGGTHAAMTDSQGGGSHLLYQDFTVPLSLGTATLRFDLYLNNHATAFASPTTLDFSTPTLNQQFRADIITTGADPFSVALSDVLLSVYQTQPGNPLVSGYVSVVADVTTLLAGHAGQTLRLRFAEVDNVNFFNAGVDNVSLQVAAGVPDLSGTMNLLLIALGAIGTVFVRCKKEPIRIA